MAEAPKMLIYTTQSVTNRREFDANFKMVHTDVILQWRARQKIKHYVQQGHIDIPAMYIRLFHE